jgi:membrane-associated phospholipid phosphatase
MSEVTYTVARPRSSWQPGRPGWQQPLAAAAACVLALALVWVLAQLVPAFHTRDAAALYHFTLLDKPRVDRAGNALLALFEPGIFTLWTALVVAVALARRRPRSAIAAAIVLTLAPLSAEALKPLLAHPHAQIGAVHIGAASWPSGHSTAALSLALAAVLVAPARLRPAVAAVGGLVALAVGGALLILAWHMPSDVLGGYLLATLWMALAVAVLRAGERRRPSARGI